MRWVRDTRKVVIAALGLLFLLILMVLIPLSASAYTYVAGTPQATPTVDITATMTALNEEKLKQEIQQLKDQNEPDFFGWLQANATMLSTLLVVIGGLFGLWRWFADRQDAQNKELKDRQVERERRAEERFQRVVADLGSDRKEPRIEATILLLTFLQPGYEQFYRQVFDLVTAYLQPLGVDTIPYDFAPLDPLRQALIKVFKQSFLCVRGEWKEQKPKSLSSDPGDYDRLGAIGVQLDQAYLVKADLRGIWMREASLRKAHLYQVKLTGAHLKGVDFTDAYLEDAQLIKADLSRANFTRAKLLKADFREADISRANFTEAVLTGANPEIAHSLKDAKMSGVIGLTKEQKDACKAKGAIIDEDSTASAPEIATMHTSLLQSSTAQTSATTPSQTIAQSANTDSAASPQQGSGS